MRTAIAKHQSQRLGAVGGTSLYLGLCPYCVRSRCYVHMFHALANEWTVEQLVEIRRGIHRMPAVAVSVSGTVPAMENLADTVIALAQQRGVDGSLPPDVVDAATSVLCDAGHLVCNEAKLPGSVTRLATALIGRVHRALDDAAPPPEEEEFVFDQASDDEASAVAARADPAHKPQATGRLREGPPTAERGTVLRAPAGELDEEESGYRAPVNPDSHMCHASVNETAPANEWTVEQLVAIRDSIPRMPLVAASGAVPAVKKLTDTAIIVAQQRGADGSLPADVIEAATSVLCDAGHLVCHKSEPPGSVTRLASALIVRIYQALDDAASAPTPAQLAQVELIQDQSAELERLRALATAMDFNVCSMTDPAVAASAHSAAVAAVELSRLTLGELYRIADSQEELIDVLRAIHAASG